MSSLWTPSGEHPVPRSPGGSGGAGTAPPAGGAAQGPPPGPRPGPGAGPDQLAGPAGEPTPEEVREAEAEMDAVRQQLLRAPAEVVIANHAMGLWELAALHLSQQPPHLPEAQLAIDAMGAMLDGLRGRLGEPEKTLDDGLAEIRMAFVQIANAERARQGAGS